MKWRNQLLALFCLLVFFAFGVFYFRYWVIQKPFGIILFIGEGLDARLLAAARVQAGGADTALTLDSLPHTGLLKNHSRNAAVPDVPAAASALATGVKVNNGAISVSPDGDELANLLAVARESGRMTGLVTNGNLTDPTAASFYAHTLTKDARADIARQLVEKAEIDVVLGGGARDFIGKEDDGQGTDKVALVDRLRDSGYEVVQTLEELEEIPWWRRAKLIGLFSQSELAFADDTEALEGQPTLSDMVRRGIELLQFNRGGYVLVVDARLMRKAAEKGDARRTVAETLELDKAISVALEYAGTKATILVCSDVATGLTPTATASHESLLPAISNAAEGPPTADGPGIRNPSEAAVSAPESGVPEPSPAATSQAASPPQTADSTNEPEDVIAFGFGLGANSLGGVHDSTVIFEIVQDNL